MKILRICTTALGYTTAVLVIGYTGTRVAVWILDNLTGWQGEVVFAAAFFTYMLFPAKHFTEGGRRWPWEPKQ